MKPVPCAADPAPELSVYRGATVWMLRRYFNMSLELGRLPSIMGREVFRSRVRCKPASFEDFVIYVHDVERCLQSLRRPDQELITRVVLQEYTQEEAARLLGRTVISVERRLPEVLDLLTEKFLRSGLMKWPALRRPAPAPSLADDLHERIDLSASAEEAPPTGDDAAVPVEIFLSSPLLSQISANQHMP